MTTGLHPLPGTTGLPTAFPKARIRAQALQKGGISGRQPQGVRIRSEKSRRDNTSVHARQSRSPGTSVAR
jgi:hypothetical protein